MPADAKRICERYKDLETRRLTRESWWQFIADYEHYNIGQFWDWDNCLIRAGLKWRAI